MFGCNSEETSMRNMGPGTVTWMCDACWAEGTTSIPLDIAREIELANLDAFSVGTEVIPPVDSKEALDNIVVKRLLSASALFTEFQYGEEFGCCLDDDCRASTFYISMDETDGEEAEKHNSDCNTLMLRRAIDDFYRYRNSL